MSLSTEFVVRHIVSIAISLAIACACFAVLSLFIWAWLSAILAGIATYYIDHTEAVHAAKVVACDAVVSGAAKALNWYRGLRAVAE